MDFKEIKRESKEALVGNRLGLLLVLVVVGIIASAISATGIGFLLTPIITVAVFYCIKHLLQNKKLVVETLYNQFKSFEHALKMIAVGLLVEVIIFVGLILLIIPGIIFAYAYSQALRIIAENPDMEIMEALRKSKEMMKGHKWELFVFQLSFIGHFLLTVITFGIYGFYFLPYYQTCQVNYYLHLSGQSGKSKDFIDPDFVIKPEDFR